MEDAKRRAAIRVQAAKRKETDEGAMGTGLSKPSAKKKPSVLLREDPKYALEKLSSIIGSEDYEDLGNHSTEAMGETGLFSIAQVRVCRNLARG